MSEAPGPSYNNVEGAPPRQRNLLPWILAAVLGGGCCLVLVLAAVLFPVFNQAKNHAGGAALDAGCMSNLKQLGLASLMYATDWDDQMLPADHWAAMLQPYLSQSAGLQCLVVDMVPNANGYGFAFNGDLGGQHLDRIKVPEDTPMIFDSILAEPNAASGLETLPDPPRHRRGTTNHIAFASGYVGSMPSGTP